MHRHTAGSRASAKFLHRPARSLRRTISLLSTFGAVAGVQLQTSRSIKPRERDLGDLRLFFLARFLTRPTNHPRHAACASNFKSKPGTPPKLRTDNLADYRDFATVWEPHRILFIGSTESRPTNCRSLRSLVGRRSAEPPVKFPSSPRKSHGVMADVSPALVHCSS